jgi:transposase
MQVAHVKLCSGSAFWLTVYYSQDHEILCDAHTRVFAALHGISWHGICDNMDTAADKADKNKGRVVNARFAAMRTHYLFDHDFCNVAFA